MRSKVPSAPLDSTRGIVDGVRLGGRLSSGGSQVALWAAVTGAGASVMVIEILGARVVGPVFGVGLYVWSSLISIALGALALGYFLGGKLADRRPNPQLLSLALGASGIWSALLPLISSPVLLLVSALGLRLGPLVGSALLFAPVLMVLGMVGPIAIRLISSTVEHAGSTAGRVFAISTAASVASALATGFAFIPSFEVNAIWMGNAAVLLLLAAFGLISRGSKASALSLPLLAGIGLLHSNGDPGPQLRIIESAESAYAKLAVVEDTSRGSALRLLRANHSFVGAHWVETQEPAFGFLHLPEAVLLARPLGKTLLALGLGTGSLPMAMSRRGVKTDVVELDDEVVRLATRHFGFQASGDVFVEDALTFVRRSSKRYDFILQDTFSGGDNPEHLLSLEMMQQLKARLRPNGILVLNLVGSDHGALAAVSHAVRKTIGHVFSDVRVFRDGPAGGAPLHNLLFFASSAPIAFGDFGNFAFENDTCEKLLRGFQAWETLRTVNQAAPLITNDANPLSRLTIPVSEAFHGVMNQLYPPSFWVH